MHLSWMRCLAALLLGVLCSGASSQPEITESSILVNHVGFTPRAVKFCLVKGTQPTEFHVVHADGNDAVFTGRMVPARGDFEEYLIGEFTAIDSPGLYRVRCGQRDSGPFRIAPDVYHDGIRKAVTYFSIQRCGPSTTGYHHPCHLDDGRRSDTSEHQDVTGGWHDACDLRRWVTATIYGMIGLSKVAEASHPAMDFGKIMEELQWGNRYFLAMQEPAGYLMNFCGGDFNRHGDDNRWTDNVPGNEDDRRIAVKPVDAAAQYCFIMAQAALVRMTRQNDPAYAAKCEEAGRRCLEWNIREKTARTTTDLGAGAAACTEMYRTFREPRFAELAADFGRQVMARQVTDSPDEQTPIRGFFRTSDKDARPLKDIYRGPWGLLGLCSLAETFPDHGDAQRWRAAIRMYCGEYLAAMARRNAFGIVPYGMYTGLRQAEAATASQAGLRQAEAATASQAGESPGGRRVGRYGYRWFMECDPKYWVGINANVASAGVGLARAARLLKEPAWTALAQRQLDWILGVNPFDASTMEDVGRNQPKQFRTSEFDPVTPHIPGAVMNGIGGTVDDRPNLMPGQWQTCEYWTPMTCYTLWLMAELQGG